MNRLTFIVSYFLDYKIAKYIYKLLLFLIYACIQLDISVNVLELCFFNHLYCDLSK